MQRTIITTYAEAVEYINSTPRFTTKNSMEDTKAFLHRLGDPDRKMRIIHVAGTNGKGSVCAYMTSILRAAGRKVALFTSPHLTDIRERFAVDGEMIPEAAFLRAFLRIYDLLDWKALEEERQGAYHPTYFEFLFFIAMLYFEEQSPDYCVLETGLGGRLDATNSVSRKELAVITHISLDHVEYLGDTVEKIAGEKAGIMSAGTPAVYWDTCSGTTRVFEKKAAELGISAHPVSKNDIGLSKIKRKVIDFSLDTRYYNNISLTLHTAALYQMENAALAVRATEVLDKGKTVTAEAVRAGVASCFWAGRMEEVLPDVYVDGAHNEDGIRAFLETVASDGYPGARLLLFGVVKDKDYERMAEEIVRSGLFRKIAVAPMRTLRGAEAEILEKLFGGYPDCLSESCESVPLAFEGLLESRKRGERVYVAGSLYLVGEIKELLEDDKFRGRIKEIPSQP